MEYFAKPAVMLGVLAWLGAAAGYHGTLLWFALAIVFSLAGDVFLVLPQPKFIAGVIAFFLAHVAYIIGLNQTPPPMGLPTVGMVVLLGLFGVPVLRQILASLKPGSGSYLRIPLVIYGSALALMTLSALLTLLRPQWALREALLVSAGGVLFLISDSLLAWNKFVGELPFGRLAVMVTYHLGQIALITGAALHFGA